MQGVDLDLDEDTSDDVTRNGLIYSDPRARTQKYYTVLAPRRLWGNGIFKLGLVQKNACALSI